MTPTITKDETFKHAYQRLYAYLRTKHPEILQEYNTYMKKAKDILIKNIQLIEENVNDL